MSWYGVLFLIGVAITLATLVCVVLTDDKPEDKFICSFFVCVFAAIFGFAPTACRMAQIRSSNGLSNPIVLENASQSGTARFIVTKQTMLTSGIEDVTLYPGEYVCLQSMTGGYKVLKSSVSDCSLNDGCDSCRMAD